MTVRCPACDSANPIGVQVCGEYDGVLVWNCSECDHFWPRFTEPDNEPYTSKARLYAARFNSGGGQEK